LGFGGKTRRKGITGKTWTQTIGQHFKVDLREISCGVMDWIDLAQDRNQWRALVSTVTNLRVLYTIGKFLTSWTIGGFPETHLHGFSVGGCNTKCSTSQRSVPNAHIT
jgi:hypothetical protein